ncbi:peptidyl prolyl cis-trans isomerase, putative [Entamoeba histolytica HM-1:IMSS-B]|uniref:Peptidyl-prolyl cis-trans isomerase n=4 Tax=Entamoeba histolytica TaxID=5759 RepID=C4M2J5_ENTH1|nr:peptidyl prolyl cis-trans isomerase, putative [Entamoeba histolytica HM-1:IMSS]EAL49411.2 peptidyl prolyl cis-trans isomerase, putative [Entamoeba histolytica HM-1:IMSS]EMH76490.1 peptidyl prolyl cis-trans isomerase, putative [Entamoeba histolytica HM-1:IMSS-B]ENY60739.1 peptidyl prolyl cis-trans isomerase, putative [Entamoeba histolytica HM-1:IMSS-A]GAT95500.1 peptidyl prolyl cis-trans isomerase putative [Entamoeba histolytica]|eukprot:XP_654797.2 peptidyl prolyl cis-trans isomerase, putative [Entamoeba histolytica HM-1:IMSS]
MSVFIETSLGNVVIDLFTEDNPVGCYNFIKLCKIEYYLHCIIYRVIKDYAIQFGDTTMGKGGNSFEGIMEGIEHKYIVCQPKTKRKNDKKGIVGFVTHGKNAIGSEVYITTGNGISGINGIAIGQIEEGMDVIEEINKVNVDENYRPYQNIRIISIEIFDDPYDDPKGFVKPKAPELILDDHPEINEMIEKIDSDTEKKIKENEAKSRAEVLEMIGDLPFAEIKPLENVLFICKMNPITNEEDLEEIFRKYGKIRSVEIIRDRKSKKSLGYGFIEFETKEGCENAYQKMDNVIIDERRIHVDFSQSIGKYGVQYDFIHKHNKWIKLKENDIRKRCEMKHNEEPKEKRQIDK